MLILTQIVWFDNKLIRNIGVPSTTIIHSKLLDFSTIRTHIMLKTDSHHEYGDKN